MFHPSFRRILGFLILLSSTLCDGAETEDPRSASKETPYTNSLGMRFVPVPADGGDLILFSIWPTRNGDYLAFIQESGRSYDKWNWAPSGQVPGTNIVVQQAQARVIKDESDLPVIHVNWFDAMAFCQWLTIKERASGRIPSNAEVRLPTDAEWSTAARLHETPGTPKEKDCRVPGYIWGTQWPPTVPVANLRLPDPANDKFENLSPVGSFAPNELGIFDLAGNVSQWCLDTYDPGKAPQRVIRGASWMEHAEPELRASNRIQMNPVQKGNLFGFRCVVAIPRGGATPNGLVVRQQAETGNFNGIITAKVKGNKVRQEANGSTGELTMLVDLDKNEVVTLFPGTKSATKTNLQALVKESPLLVEAFRKDKGWTSPAPTGTKEKVGIWNTEVYTSQWSGASAKMWVTQEIPNWQEIKRGLERFGLAMSPCAYDPAMLDLPGLAVKTVLQAGSNNASMTVLTIYEAEITDSEFAIPPGFKVLEGNAPAAAISSQAKPAATMAPPQPKAAPPAAMPPPLDPKHFEISTIIIGAPSIAMINGKDYEVGSVIQAPKSSLPVKLIRISESSVTLSNGSSTIEVPIGTRKRK